MQHSIWGPNPVRFGQSWIVPGLKSGKISKGNVISTDPLLQQIQRMSERKLAMLNGQAVGPSESEKQAASQKQLLSALGKLLNQQHGGPSQKGTISAKNLDFSKPYQ